MELIHPIFKWLHVVAGIMWIGLLYFFNFVNTAFAPTMDADTKKKVVPELMPRTLYFFRMGAWRPGRTREAGRANSQNKKVNESISPKQTNSNIFKIDPEINNSARFLF